MTHSGCSLLLVVEECIASRQESVPYSIAVFFGNSAYCLPLLLQFYEFIGSLFPVGAVAQDLSTLTQSNLLGEIGRQCFFRILEEFCLGCKEFVACGTESGKERIIHLT